MTTTKIKMFATSNDTDKWALCVDGYFGLFDDRAEAERVYNLIMSGCDHFDDTVFGSCDTLNPGHESTGHTWDDSEPDFISHHRAIDIEAYILKRPMRSTRQFISPRPTAKEKLDARRFWAELTKED